MSELQQAIETIAQNALGHVVLAVGQDSQLYSSNNETGLVLPLLSAASGNLLDPAEIIRTIQNIERMKPRSRSTAPSRSRRSARKPAAARENTAAKTAGAEKPAAPESA